MGHLATPYYLPPRKTGGPSFCTRICRAVVPTDENGAMRLFFEGCARARHTLGSVGSAPFLVVRICRRELHGRVCALRSSCGGSGPSMKNSHFPRRRWRWNSCRKRAKARGRRWWAARHFGLARAIPLTVICWNNPLVFHARFPENPNHTRRRRGRVLHVSRYIPDRYFYIGIQFFIAGFAYWTSLDVLFSIWFFYLLIVGESIPLTESAIRLARLGCGRQHTRPMPGRHLGPWHVCCAGDCGWHASISKAFGMRFRGRKDVG